MLDSILLYASFAAMLFGGAMLLRKKTRRMGAGAVAVGIAGAGLALAWPVAEKQASGTSRIDKAMPVWEFDERHEVEVAATPEAIFRAVHDVRADDIRFFRTLVAIRRAGRKGPESILDPGHERPILDVALRSGFFVMADDEPREFVIGSVIIRPNRVVAAMNFLVIPNGRTSRLITETRVHATDADARQRFRIYWRVIHPGSDIIRRSWLQAIKRRAESSVSGA